MSSLWEEKEFNFKITSPWCKGKKKSENTRSSRRSTTSIVYEVVVYYAYKKSQPEETMG
jgi:hypothetical protein